MSATPAPAPLAQTPSSALRTRHIVIMQPYFLPYRNYFGLIRRCDLFVLFDDVQFCRKWQQRNCIPDGNGGKAWLTIPVISKRPDAQLIRDVRIARGGAWARALLRRVRQVYGAHPGFELAYPGLERVLLAPDERLVDLTVALLQWCAAAMGMPAPEWRWSSDLGVTLADRNLRLIEMCRQLGTTHYVCGPAAKVYLREDLFADAGIEVIWHEETYPPYPQAATPTFDHFVSALDLLMNHGAASHAYVQPIHAA